MGASTMLQKRKDIIEKIARYKWDNDVAIEDPEREETVILWAVAIAKKYSLDEDAIKEKIKTMIAESVAVQKKLFDLWKKEGITTFGDNNDIKTLREELDTITESLIIDH
ncbi:MAG: hypothetical protein HN411_02370 [Waddliaceae bacterium]|jgi:chorismate mutase|nr:hypothetical protein [Waddliaceae bacterium]MBT3578743.1 hypothetical protein [Waddliaceae bacterium]MBT4444355.1 hypothetical protein [Waddliaceae bacterium]MBT6928270.1 hypothetical protein [Waddliaceae bacterium]MBT7264956.1 hypothetical protein [Waddliaceae bacterium]